MAFTIRQHVIGIASRIMNVSDKWQSIIGVACFLFSEIVMHSTNQDVVSVMKTSLGQFSDKTNQLILINNNRKNILNKILLWYIGEQDYMNKAKINVFISLRIRK